MTKNARMPHIAVLCLLAIVFGSMLLFLPAIPQDTTYHDFADKRTWLGIQNFGDVAGNVAFILSGCMGLFTVWKKRNDIKNVQIWGMFFIGVFLTGFGSAYYHLTPNNHTLVWDRLPMTISFMSIFSALISERVSAKYGTLLFPLFICAGIASIWYWDMTENSGLGDLRPYIMIQFFPMVAILYILKFFPSTHADTRYLVYTLAFYIAAKIFEHYDVEIFKISGSIISGHTIKHLAAATGTVTVIKYINPKKRKV